MPLWQVSVLKKTSDALIPVLAFETFGVVGIFLFLPGYVIICIFRWEEVVPECVKTYRNQIVVFLACGLWHGANVTFVLWGLWHGMFLVIERMFSGNWTSRVPRFLCRSYAFLVVLMGWVLFRADNIHEAGKYFLAMFSPTSQPFMMEDYTFSLGALGVGIVFCLIPDRWLPAPKDVLRGVFTVALFVFHFLLAVLSVASLHPVFRFLHILQLLILLLHDMVKF